MPSKTIILDPGHGGDDPGALGRRTGLRECDVALWVAARIEHKLRQNPEYRVVHTHGGDGSTLGQRAHLANELAADLFLSIHCNSAVSERAHGYEVFTSPGETAADVIATILYQAIGEAFPELRGRPGRDDGDPDKEARFFVLRKTRMAAVLVELAFISNFSEEILLGSDVWRWRYADAIADGVASWL